MNQNERRRYLIRYLLDENQQYRGEAIPAGAKEQRLLLRALMNVRPPRDTEEEFLAIQDDYLAEETQQKRITDLDDLTPACVLPDGSGTSEAETVTFVDHTTLLDVGRNALPVPKDSFPGEKTTADGPDVPSRKGSAAASAPKESSAGERALYLWQGDITTLRCDAIVNAANSGMTGCYVPNHRCIDNCIHTYAGVQLRRDCAKMMARQGHEEPTGSAKLTPAYNLPCRYVLHTVGPIIYGAPTGEDERLLASCYHSCLELASQHDLESIAFCCISTGEFHFPNDLAAAIAIRTVTRFLNQNPDSSVKQVIFNVFKDEDWTIYEQLLTLVHQDS